MKPNIVIVVWDAVRARNLPFYGYSRNTTPKLLEMEQELAVYRNAISCSYWTLPSITSLFTGMYPSAHGLLVDGDKLNPKIVSLPQFLKKHGYSCAAFNRNPYVSPFTGLDRGFDDFVAEPGCLWDYLKKLERKLKRKFSKDPSFNPSKQSDEKARGSRRRLGVMLKHLPDVFIDSGSRGLVKRFSEWLDDKDKRPFFAFFQAIESHSPYRAPLGFGLQFLSLRDLGRKLFINQDHLAYALGEITISAQQFQILRGAYDNAIHYCDFITGEICAALKASNCYDNTLLIVMADHGESIGEHNLMFHIWSLYDNLIKVPMMVKYPKDVGLTGHIEEVVQNVDILPTICSLLKTNSDLREDQIQGNSLLDTSIRNRRDGIAVSELIKPFGPDKIAYRHRLAKFDRRLASVRTTAKKFIYSSRGDHEFYDFNKDPEELDNLYGRVNDYDGLDERAVYYYQKVDSCYQDNRARIEGEDSSKIEDEDIQNQLKHLGYL